MFGPAVRIGIPPQIANLYGILAAAQAKRKAGVFFCLLLLAFLPNGRLAAGEYGPKPSGRSVPGLQSPASDWHPAFDPVTVRAGMAQVLLIGDSISIDYTLHVRALLARRADVHRPPENCESTALGLKELDRRWDVIHFNWGLHDLKLINPEGDLKRHDRRQAVALDEYGRSLKTLIGRLQETGAKLIWATTTPVPAGTRNRLAGEEKKYNAVAAKIMLESDITVDDLHAFVLPRLKDIQLPNNVHFTPEGSMLLAKQVASHILEALGRLAESRSNIGVHTR